MANVVRVVAMRLARGMGGGEPDLTALMKAWLSARRPLSWRDRDNPRPHRAKLDKSYAALTNPDHLFEYKQQTVVSTFHVLIPVVSKTVCIPKRRRFFITVEFRNFFIVVHIAFFLCHPYHAH